ncbi:unnamed protein product [Caenorhabditis auriculariae]|uniref:Uncharacterized protein n=1 Tax=Caenorhabditis auriculariae TaxID=2777116 RepID=A0A8S1HUE5_9PELO|nr:unnamed protein product [Caenorhabditis auriculariae]
MSVDTCHSPHQSFNNLSSYFCTSSSIIFASFTIFIVVTRSPTSLKLYQLILIQYLIWTTIFSLSYTFNGKLDFYSEYMVFLKEPFMDKDFPNERCNIEENRIFLISPEGLGLLQLNLMVVTMSAGVMIAAFALHSFVVLNRYNLHLSEKTRKLQRGYLKSLLVMVITPILVLLFPAIALTIVCTWGDCHNSAIVEIFVTIAASLFSAFGAITSVLLIVVHKQFRSFFSKPASADSPTQTQFQLRVSTTFHSRKPGLFN